MAEATSALNANGLIRVHVTGIALRRQGLTDERYLSTLTVNDGQEIVPAVFHWQYTPEPYDSRTSRESITTDNDKEQPDPVKLKGR